MYKVALIVALCLASGYAAKTKPSVSRKITNPFNNRGVVDPAYRCGGVGTPVQLRISECDGVCSLRPGHLYHCEEDFFPATAAPSLSLRVEICLDSGICTDILDAVLENSSVQPGQLYTASHDIVPNDVLSGLTVEFKAHIYHTDTLLEEICVSADINIL